MAQRAGNLGGARQIGPEHLGALALSKTVTSIVSDGAVENLITRPTDADGGAAVRSLVLQADAGDWRLRNGDYVAKSITAFDDTGGAAPDIATIATHGYSTGDGPFRLTEAAGDSVPAGLAVDTDYWLVVQTASTFQFAETLADALAVSPVIVDFGDDGTIAVDIILAGSADGASDGEGWANTADPVAGDGATLGYGAAKLGEGATLIMSAPALLTVRAFVSGNVLTYWFI